MNITIILFGTTHETQRENILFEVLNNIIDKKKLKNSYWLCEGEQYDRKCISIKDNDLHLLTDALFINMMLLDDNKINGDIKNEFNQNFNDRMMELFITINKSKYKNTIISNNKYIKCFDLLHKYNVLDNRTLFEKCIENGHDYYIHNFRKFIKYIIDLLLNNNVIDASYKKCIFDFYNTGYICEDEILTVMREKSFIKIILMFITNLMKQYNQKIRVIITVGTDHVEPLKKILNNLTKNIHIVY
jgi:hypothetical protein